MGDLTAYDTAIIWVSTVGLILSFGGLAFVVWAFPVEEGQELRPQKRER